jgi:hypothetical protein
MLQATGDIAQHQMEKEEERNEEPSLKEISTIQSSGHDAPSMDGAVVMDANEVLRLTRSCTKNP